MNYNFDENEMPYGILERFGLTQAMIDDLPTDVLQNIYNGRKSPVLPVHITADDGEEVKARTRFSVWSSLTSCYGNLNSNFNPVAGQGYASGGVFAIIRISLSVKEQI